MTIDMLANPFVGQGIDVVVGIESRGFILGAAVAERIKAGFIPIRKPGKLPSKTLKESYALEYGTDALEVHEDAVETGTTGPDRGRRPGDRGHGGGRRAAGEEARWGPACGWRFSSSCSS